MKVAAIVSAYYCEPYLAGRLENLKSQTLRPQIVVVCQRGSEEEKIADHHLGHDDILLTTDGVPTIYAAWNLGIEVTNTEYVTSSNSDDRLAPNGIEILARTLDDNPDVALVYPDVDIVDSLEYLDMPFERILGWNFQSGRFRFAEGGFERLMQVCFIGPMPMWRRSLHEKHGWFDAEMKSAGDYEFWLRIAKAGEKLLHVRQVLGIYLDRPDSAEHRDPAIGAHETRVARARYALPRRTVYAKVGPS